MEFIRQINMLIPFLIISAVVAVVARLLAKEKGRNVVLWTVLGAIPVVNFFCMSFFIGATNLRLERKIDELLKRSGVDPTTGTQL